MTLFITSLEVIVAETGVGQVDYLNRYPFKTYEMDDYFG